MCVISSSIGVTSNDDECMTGQAMCVASRSFFLFFFAVVRLSYTRYLRSKLFDFIRQFLTLARVLPFGRFFTLHNLQEMQMFLFQLFLLRQKFVETNFKMTRLL